MGFLFKSSEEQYTEFGESEEAKKKRLASQTDLQRSAESATGGFFNELKNLVSSGGPGASDVAGSTEASRGFADMLKKFSESGMMPTDGDLTNSNTFAKNAFAPERLAMEHGFEDQRTEAARMSASLGRPVDDPVLQAKLRTGFMRDNSMLNARQGAFANDYAMNLPRERLGLAESRVNLMDQLSQRAIGNRNLLLGLGSNLLAQERNWQTARGRKVNEKTPSVMEGIGQVAGLAGGIMSGGAAAGLWGGGAAGAGARSLASMGGGGGFSMPSMSTFSTPSFGSSMMGAYGAPPVASGNMFSAPPRFMQPPAYPGGYNTAFTPGSPFTSAPAIGGYR